MTRLGRTVLAAALAVTAAVASAAPKPKKVNSPKPAPDVYGGYSWTHAGEASLHGWSLAGSYPFHTGANRFVLDVSGHYGSFASADLSQLAVMGGVRRVWSETHGVHPFAETLLGFARTGASATGASASDTDWGVAIGGGLDHSLGVRWSIRGLAQLRLIRGEGTIDTDPRLSIGFVYRLRL